MKNSSQTRRRNKPSRKVFRFVPWEMAKHVSEERHTTASSDAEATKKKCEKTFPFLRTLFYYTSFTRPWSKRAHSRVSVVYHGFCRQRLVVEARRKQDSKVVEFNVEPIENCLKISIQLWSWKFNNFTLVPWKSPFFSFCSFALLIKFYRQFQFPKFCKSESSLQLIVLMEKVRIGAGKGKKSLESISQVSPSILAWLRCDDERIWDWKLLNFRQW